MGVSILTAITYLFYSSIWALLISLPLLIPYIKAWERQQELQIKQQFLLQLKEYLQSLATAMGAGYAVENAMKEARTDLSRYYQEDKGIMKDLLKMERLLQMNVPVEKIWEQWAKNVNMPQLDQFVTVFTLAKRSGGDSVKIIRKAIVNICEKIEIEQEIQVGLTGKRLEFQVMSFIPVGILLYMRLSFPEFMDVLYGNLLGVSIMSLCLVVYGGAYMWGSKIVEIEV